MLPFLLKVVDHLGVSIGKLLPNVIHVDADLFPQLDVLISMQYVNILNG